MLRMFYKAKLRVASRLRYLRNHWFWQFFFGIEQTPELMRVINIKQGLEKALPVPVVMVIEDSEWSVRFETPDAVIAVVVVRNRKGKPFFYVDIRDGFSQYKAYFEAALIGVAAHYGPAPKILTRRKMILRRPK